MVRISAIVAASLVLSATAAMAQTRAMPLPGDATTTPTHSQQQAMAPERDKGMIGSFIFDEYGNVYDSRGDIIKPRPPRH